MGRDRIVAQHRVAGLREIVDPEEGEGAEENGPDLEEPVRPRRRAGGDQREKDERQKHR